MRHSHVVLLSTPSRYVLPCLQTRHFLLGELTEILPALAIEGHATRASAGRDLACVAKQKRAAEMHSAVWGLPGFSFQPIQVLCEGHDADRIFILSCAFQFGLSMAKARFEPSDRSSRCSTYFDFRGAALAFLCLEVAPVR